MIGFSLSTNFVENPKEACEKDLASRHSSDFSFGTGVRHPRTI
jgi:hypothetical protein